MTNARKERHDTHAHDDPDLDYLEGQTGNEMVAEVAAARKAGTLRRKATLTAPATLAARVAAAFDRESAQESRAETDEARQIGHPIEPLIPITVRMPASMVAALKAEADRQGVRGYQTLLKQWVEERLSGEKVVSVRRVATVLKPLQKLIGADESPSLGQEPNGSCTKPEQF